MIQHAQEAAAGGALATLLAWRTRRRAESLRGRVVRKVIIRLTLLGIGCVISLLVLESVIRVLQLAPSQGVGSVTESDFSRIPGLLTPGQDLILVMSRSMAQGPAVGMLSSWLRSRPTVLLWLYRVQRRRSRRIGRPSGARAAAVRARPMAR